MARVAFPFRDTEATRAADVGGFVAVFAEMLAEAGDEVALVLLRAGPSAADVDPRWREECRTQGIQLIDVRDEPVRPSAWTDIWPMQLSERLAAILRTFDVVYFADSAELAIQTVRTRRFTTSPTPVCVTILHRPCNWTLAVARRYPAIPSHLNLEFVERYSARHSDFVIAPSRQMLDWVAKEGWQFAREPEVLGLPYRSEGAGTTGAAAHDLKRLMLYGGSDRRGFDLFVSAVRELARESPEDLGRVDEIVFTGRQDGAWEADRALRELRRTGLSVRHLGNLDRSQASAYLRRHVCDTLVVVASPAEQPAGAVIQASLIPGLNVICAREGGAPEVFAGNGEAQLFDPLPRALAAKIGERLRVPLAPDQLARYDFAAANERWLAFHRRACGEAGRARPSPPVVAAVPAHASVAVCVTYYDKAQHFPQLLQSLERQTTQDFTVIAVDDGSPDAEARAAFDGMAEKYAPKGWQFFRQPNRYVDAARNRAAERARTEYLLMIDADDVLAWNAVERLLGAARLSGDDCLVSAGYLFTGDEFPYDLETGEVIAPLVAAYMPMGPNVVAGLLAPVVFGGPAILIRRQVFEAMGGYREVRGSAHEDWELHARLALAGYKTDVVPEYLHFYRQVDDGLARTSDDFLAKQRMVETYDRHLASVGLFGAGRAMYALYRQWRDLERYARELEVRLGMEKQRSPVVGSQDGLPTFADDGEGPRVMRALLRVYRRHVSPETRLRLYLRALKLIGLRPHP